MDELDAYKEVGKLFGESQMKLSIRQYCVNCVAHRLCKFGWEPQLNWYDAKMLLLLSLAMPEHTRMPIIMEAWRKATITRDQVVIDFLELHFQARLELTA